MPFYFDSKVELVSKTMDHYEKWHWRKWLHSEDVKHKPLRCSMLQTLVCSLTFRPVCHLYLLCDSHNFDDACCCQWYLCPKAWWDGPHQRAVSTYPDVKSKYAAWSEFILHSWAGLWPWESTYCPDFNLWCNQVTDCCWHHYTVLPVRFVLHISMFQ